MLEPKVPKINLYLHLETIPGVMKRHQHVLILVQNELGEFVLASKKVYPPGIYRLIGGGIESGEEPDKAAHRELHEELHISPDPKDIIALAQVEAHITQSDEPHPIIFTTYLYFTKVQTQTLKPDSDIDEIKTFSVTQFEELIKKYRLLSADIDPHTGFAWKDYGRLYTKIHEIALNEWRQLMKS